MIEWLRPSPERYSRTMASHMGGKRCLITGANTGIGKETAAGLAEMGADIVMVCRSQSKGAAAAEEIRKRASRAGPSGQPPDIDLLVADLSSQREVRKLAQDVKDTYERLDVLISNAGVITPRRKLTIDGLESQFAVNHLAPFLLCNLLRPLLEASAPSRIVIVASQVEGRGRIDFANLQGERNYDYMAAYCQSKLANVLFTYQLARQLQGTGVTANCLHPGVIATNLLSDYMGRPRSVGGLVQRFTHPGPKVGAQTSIRLASDPQLAEVSGCYFHDKQGQTRSSAASYDEDLQEQLWRESERLTRWPADS